MVNCVCCAIRENLFLGYGISAELSGGIWKSVAMTFSLISAGACGFRTV